MALFDEISMLPCMKFIDVHDPACTCQYADMIGGAMCIFPTDLDMIILFGQYICMFLMITTKRERNIVD